MKKLILFIEKRFAILLVIYIVVSMLFIFCIDGVAYDENGLQVVLFKSIGDKSAARGLFILTLTAVLCAFKIKDGKIVIDRSNDRSTPRMS